VSSAPAIAVTDPLAPRAPDAGLVARPALVRRLCESAAPLVVLHAPAGYGKTALLRQWAECDERAFAWLDVGEVGDDPATLLDALATQRDGVGAPQVLVLDHGQALADALALVADVALRQRPGFTIALATRGEPELPLGRLRVQGQVLELGPDDLALGAQEAALLLRTAGLALEAREVGELLARTQGWAAGVRLAALAVGDQADPAAAVAAFGGDDRYVADYLRDAVLKPLAPGEMQFLRRAAPLEELSGPLCDAALGRSGSGELLRSLARAGLLLTAVDRAERCFRMHPLLADMLAAELRRTEPVLERRLHRRASAWHAEAGDLDRALRHALAADDSVRAAELVRDVTTAHATRDRGLERWRASAGSTAPTRASAGMEVLRAAFTRGDAETLVAAAGCAREVAGDGPWRSTAALLAGAALRLIGAPERARAALADGVREGVVPTPTVRASALALLALQELEADDAQAAGVLLEPALGELATNALGHDPACALVHAAAAWVRAQAGAIEQARADAERARGLLADLADPAPWYAAETRLALARALLRLSDAAAARELLTDAGRTLRELPDAVGLRARLDDAWERIDSFAIGAVAGPSALTIAELRVLRFLPSHLSFREIAERLHVSANTVKTQAHAVYRKLDASSRSEAVARARQVGLVDP
jgi:LuxR family transcriptional regulator, maltose regulon positive regulatory protein